MQNATEQKFTTTHWSVVAAARDSSSPGAREALERLCCAYWYPLYAYVRRQGNSPADAEDLTQAFFAFILEKQALVTVDQEKGKFRSFLLAAFTHFFLDQLDRSQAAKRGGGRQIIHLDGLAPEDRYRLEPADPVSPEKLFERRWALTVLDQARVLLKAECAAAGKA